MTFIFPFSTYAEPLACLIRPDSKTVATVKKDIVNTQKEKK
jgi:hypothetical protein